MEIFNCLPVADAISRCRNNLVLEFRQSDNFFFHICCLTLPYLRGELTLSTEATEVGPMHIPEMPKG